MLDDMEKDGAAPTDAEPADKERLLIDLQISTVAAIRGAKILKDGFLVYLLEMVLKHIRGKLGQRVDES